jgi:N-glycosidase YbiA
MIDSFTGKYRFLSNFWPCKNLIYQGLTYPTVEHAYVAAKTIDGNMRVAIQNTATAGQVKRLGRQLILREDWEEIKLPIMTTLVYDKFFLNPDLAQMLLETGEQELVEGNTWGDMFWGEYLGSGLNHLGKILMSVRKQLTHS